MAVKKVLSNFGSIFKVGKAGASARSKWNDSLFLGTGVSTIAAGMAAFSLGGWLQSPGRSQNVTDSSRNPYNTHNFKQSGFIRRQATLAAIGMSNPAAGNFLGLPGTATLSGAAGAVGYYNIERAKDIFESSRQVLKPMGVGAAGGVGLGVITGLAASAFTKLPVGKTVSWMAGLGAIAGGYNARKVSLQVVEGFNVAKKNSINRRRLSGRARTRGSGYRLWTNANRMGKPGHLGMDGSMPFAMHDARHRSTV